MTAYGDPIRYLADLGSQSEPNTPRFDGPTIPAGSLGTYLADVQVSMKEAGHPQADGMAGWHLTSTEVDGETYFVPVAEGHFEPVT